MSAAPDELIVFLQYRSTATLDRAFLRYYSTDGGEQSHELFAGLLAAQGLAHWRALIRQAIATYRRRQYLVVVPSLLLVLDGAAALIGALRRKTVAHTIAAQMRKTAEGSIKRLIWLSLDGFLARPR